MVPGTWFLVPGTRYPAPGTCYQVPEHLFGSSERLFEVFEHLFVFGEHCSLPTLPQADNGDGSLQEEQGGVILKSLVPGERHGPMDLEADISHLILAGHTLHVYL